MTGETPRLTRRAVLGGAAAAGAGLLIGPAGAGARARSAAGVFSRRLGTVSGTASVIAPGTPFVLAGVQWSGPPAARIEIRARARDGRWSRWAAASVAGHGPDRPAVAAHFGAPVWFGAADAVQVRSDGPVAGVQLHFVGAGAVAGGFSAVVARAATHGVAARMPLAQPALQAGGGQPPIIARSAWAGSGHRPAEGPFYGAVEMAFVHHSDNPNGYGAAEVPAMLLAIYDYHRYAQRWDDIGYNFVIDAFGRVWEARAGGIDEPVIGAQAGGYNAVSTGICMLGTFGSQLPTPAALTTLERLLAWKLSLHGVPARGRVDVRVEPMTGSYTSFRVGEVVSLPRIAGHRDGDSTSCPGDALYGHLPAVRQRVAARVGEVAVLTLTASQVGGPLGTPVALTGELKRLNRGGAPIPGAQVAIQTVTGLGTASTIVTVTTAADGTWSAPELTLERSEIVRALWAGPPAAVSNLLGLEVIPVVTLSAVSVSPLRVTGTISPAKRRVTLSVYKLAGPHRRLVGTRRIALGHGGVFSARLGGLGRKASGRYEVVARTAADAVTAAGASRPLAFTLP